MASLRKHARSPFWYLRRRNLDTHIWEEESTGLRIDSPEDTRKAQRKVEKVSIDERRVGGRSSPAFLAWVPDYIATRWNEASGSKRRYQSAWYAIQQFLAERDIIYPRQIRYAHGADYLQWRRQTKVFDKSVGHNTALLEVKFLSQLLNEAVRRDFAESNPLGRLGIARAAQKIKPELTDKQIKTLRNALKEQPEWMLTAFEISLYTGCRFSECAMPMDNLDLRAGTIRMRDSKRDENDPRKFFTVPIHPRLRPLLARLKKRKALVTCELSQDKNGRINKVFKKAGVVASFHSLRVTFITRCHRGGLSEAEAMRLVNHSSQLVHRIYSRLNVDDVREAQKKIPLP